jgi:type III restriction enzyme
MQRHFWQDAEVVYDVVVTRGFTELRSSAYTAAVDEEPLDFRISPPDKSNMSLGGFSRRLYAAQKFQSDAEPKLAVIPERESLKWFKPARGQFQLFYRSGTEDLEYQPDFVAETERAIYMLEPKAANQLRDTDVLAKQEVAVQWCRLATEHSATYQGKPWKYALIPHDVIAET